MREKPEQTAAQREALKTLIVYVHWEATSRTEKAPHVSLELRRLADKISDLAHRGTSRVLAEFFGSLG